VTRLEGSRRGRTRRQGEERREKRLFEVTSAKIDQRNEQQSRRKREERREQKEETREHKGPNIRVDTFLQKKRVANIQVDRQLESLHFRDES